MPLDAANKAVWEKICSQPRLNTLPWKEARRLSNTCATRQALLDVLGRALQTALWSTESALQGDLNSANDLESAAGTLRPASRSTLS